MSSDKRRNAMSARVKRERALTKQIIETMIGESMSSAAGEKVGPRESLHLSVYYACMRNIAEDAAKLPLILYEQMDRGKKRRPDLPLYHVLHDSPNAEMTSFTFRSVLTAHAIGWGNGYAEIERNGNGEALALWPLVPEHVNVKRLGGEIIYEKQQPGQSPVLLTSDQVFHIPGLGYDGLIGHSPAALARESVGMALATQKFNGAFFSNGTWLSGVVKHPSRLKPAAMENLRTSLKSKHAGADNAFSLMILEEGMDYAQTGIPPRDAQLIELCQFQVEDICRWFRMPPHKVGHLLRAAGWSTLEATNADYLTDTLMPWLARWEQEIRRKLIRTPNVFAEHLVEGLLRADTLTRYQAYKTALDGQFMTPNEVRERENMNPVPWGDEPVIPQGAATKDEAEPEPKPEAEDKADGDGNKKGARACSQSTTSIGSKTRRRTRTASSAKTAS